MSDEGSVDFDIDFFDTPRSPSPSKSENVSSRAHGKVDPETDSKKSPAKKETQRSPSPGSKSATPNYSSDSYESDTDSESKSQNLKKKDAWSHSSSSSSLSSRSRDNVRSGRNGSDSRSRSSSRSETDRGRKPRPSDSQKSVSNRGKSWHEEDDYSSSAYSDGDNGKSISSSNHKSTSQKKNGKRQAWGENQDSDRKNTDKRQSLKTRPMTAKSRPAQRQQPRKKPDSDSDALSDSDITDVSPMESPRTQEKRSFDQRSAVQSYVGDAGDGHSVKAQYRAMPVSHKDLNGDEEEDADNPPRGGLDLEILMKAVGELEKQKRFEANTRRVMFAPMTLKKNDKSNYTFDKDKSRDIERENQRLLKEIVRRVNAGDQHKQYRPSQPPVSRMTPSAVNREKEMRRIENENMSILKRLQKVKPTQSIARSHQIKSYENTKLHGIPISTLHPLPRTSSRTASRAEDSVSSIGSRTRSLTSLHSVASSVRSSGSRRSSRPGSATKRVDMRPEWTDRW